MLSTDITSQNFTISAANTTDWINPSATSQRANCLIETYSNDVKIMEMLDGGMQQKIQLNYIFLIL